MVAVPRVLLGSGRIFRFFENNLTAVNLKYFHATAPTFAERLFTEKHEWVRVDGKIGTVGISHYAQESLGDVVYAQLPDVGTELKQTDECGALESVKAASEIYSPVSGKVVEKNGQVEDTPSLINTSCYDKGWLFKLELSNESELQDLMTQRKYDEFLKSQESH
ncbi:glycine cleavage system H protein, mitochondrial [Cylas formicarius]|uniref:glycine cleavage system H protein, mitochondrial n=1 Tax=Cylas formicarius TaxID=197179 RepID=UPI0029588492|nr:glycine cleavage system H protein, mitochondrial [Cylas formicarius]